MEKLTVAECCTYTVGSNTISLYFCNNYPKQNNMQVEILTYFVKMSNGSFTLKLKDFSYSLLLFKFNKLSEESKKIILKFFTCKAEISTFMSKFQLLYWNFNLHVKVKSQLKNWWKFTFSKNDEILTLKSVFQVVS